MVSKPAAQIATRASGGTARSSGESAAFRLSPPEAGRLLKRMAALGAEPAPFTSYAYYNSDKFGL